MEESSRRVCANGCEHFAMLAAAEAITHESAKSAVTPETVDQGDAPGFSW